MKMQKEKLELETLIKEGAINEDVVRILLPKNIPHDFETEFWDYKEKAPTPADQQNKKEYEKEVHELIKDIVSFYNSHGGYILFGVKDKGKNRIIGCNNILDCDDIQKKIIGATGKVISIYYKQFKISDTNIGLLLIPKRRDLDPVKFIKKGPKSSYSKNSVYIRKASECIPASSSQEDWKFLFSNRNLENNDVIPLKNVQENLPPRDLELIEFVGRQQELQTLRDWFLDDKSPIRLLTGIGGLGKTSLAYKFAEEIRQVSAGNVDAIIWLTAKKSTFAALSGKMIKTTRHDFSNTEELLIKLLGEISGESSVEEDMDVEDLADAIVEGLIYKSSLIIVDDLDSLSPDNQKECAQILQQIAFRTVDREVAHSRILLTSRLDLGMPITSVIKIFGLPEHDFQKHLENLCVQFELSNFSKQIRKEIYRTSSGSPLFSSAIVRLISLGESPSNVCKSWATSDGVDIRQFTFKRELERLSPLSAKLMLAVLRLGEVSIEELIDVLETSKPKVFDCISELQGYHLISKTENKYGDIIFSASKELVSVTDILRAHIGKASEPIDRACARISQNESSQIREIGTSITRIVTLWSEQKNNEALIKAKELADRYKRHGDAHCALGKAFLKVSPAKFKEADASFALADKYNCRRPELFSLIIETKKGLEDWQGLRSHVLRGSSNINYQVHTIDALIEANSSLYDLAMTRTKYNEASKYAFEVIEKISHKISNSHLQEGYFAKLCKEQSRFSSMYIRALDSDNPRQGDKLEIINAVIRLFYLNVYSKNLFNTAIKALSEWFLDIEKRSILDKTALKILQEKIEMLRNIEKKLPSGTPENSEAKIRDIEHRGALLLTKTNRSA